MCAAGADPVDGMRNKAQLDSGPLPIPRGFYPTEFSCTGRLNSVCNLGDIHWDAEIAIVI